MKVTVEYLDAKVEKTFNLSAKPDEIIVLNPVEDVIIEAEDATLSYNQYKGNELAHGGAYVGSIDNVKQGVYLQVMAFVTGTYEMEVYYTTGAPVAYHEVFVNGKSFGKVGYEVNTGWGSVDAYDPEKTSIDIDLEAGYNIITVIKNGNDDNWAELDYFVIKAIDAEYNPNDFTNVELPAFILEAEMATLIGPNIRINPLANGGAYVGGIDNVDQGIFISFLCSSFRNI